MPALELDDGTVLVQTNAIMEYIGSTYNLKGSSPIETYRGQSVYEYFWSDFFSKSVAPTWFASPETHAATLETAEAATYVMMDKLASKLTDKTFLCGDKISIYDMVVAGYFTNTFVNPSAKDADVWARVWSKAPERVQKYIADFQEEMKEYLAARKAGLPL